MMYPGLRLAKWGARILQTHSGASALDLGVSRTAHVCLSQSWLLPKAILAVSSLCGEVTVEQEKGHTQYLVSRIGVIRLSVIIRSQSSTSPVHRGNV